MNEEGVTDLASDKTPEELLAKKTGVMVAIPNMGSEVSTALVHFVSTLMFKTIDTDCPWFFKVMMPNDLSPVEYARNHCVKEFLKDPFYKKLWFIDSDVVPPLNAIDMLDFSDPMVSGMTFIWTGEKLDSEGFYKPPSMKINAFTWRPENQDFLSIVPKPSGEAFYCDAAGCAALVVNREVFLDVPEPWFRVPRDPYGATLRSEDLEFTRAATARGHQLLYVPKVKFGHIKKVDLQQVLNYSLACSRGATEVLKSKMVCEEDKAMVPDIRFAGERPAPEPKHAPKDFELMKGAKAV
jgi:hypothetical protein